jgi:hypothetical protein
MSYDLRNSKRWFQLNQTAWPQILELSIYYGWTPEGTKICDEMMEIFGWEKPWDGAYDSSDGQSVTSTDAKNIATALEMALQDIPDIDLGEPVAGNTFIHNDTFNDKKLLKEFIESMVKPKRLDKSALLLRFSGEENKQYIKGFVEFCKEGEGFRIN